MSYPRNEFTVDYMIPVCLTYECGGKIEWKFDDNYNEWFGDCPDCGAIYDGPTKESELAREHQEEKI